MRMLTPRTAALTVLSALLLAGCATYKPGSGAPTGTGTIWVAPAINKSYMPQVAAVITERVREAFLEDGEGVIARREDADTRLDITVTQLERNGRASGLPVLDVQKVDGVNTVVTQNDRGIDKAYDITLVVHAVLTNSNNGKVLFDRDFQTSTQTLASPYVVTNADEERMLMPVLARDLARQIHDSIAHGWADSQK